MSSGNKSWIQKYFNVEPYEALKFLFLTAIFFFTIAGYTLAKELKDAVFLGIVGKEYIPWAKVLSMFILIPAILFYTTLVDRLRRYQLLFGYAFFYGIATLVAAYFVGHETIGMLNTDTSAYRLFGWLFYFLIEGYSPFVVGVFWAFASSVNSPESAKKSYGYMVSGSKIGGLFSSGVAYLFFTWYSSNGNTLLDDVFAHQVMMVFSAILILFVPLMVMLLMKFVPGHYLHGYEVAYRIEKERSKQGKVKTGLLEGLRLMLRYPYVLGIFGMVYFYEIVATILSYLKLGVAQNSSVNLAGTSAYLFWIAFTAHSVGLLIAFFGTSNLLKRLGERVCLLLVPLFSGVLLLYAMIDMAPHSIVMAVVALKAINYAFSWPVRESLYIPTIKEIKFKSKSWIDAFGSKFAKTSGSTFNIMINGVLPSLILPMHAGFFAIIILLWFGTSFLLGRKFEWVINNKEVIGYKKPDINGEKL